MTVLSERHAQYSELRASSSKSRRGLHVRNCFSISCWRHEGASGGGSGAAGVPPPTSLSLPPSRLRYLPLLYCSAQASSAAFGNELATRKLDRRKRTNERTDGADSRQTDDGGDGDLRRGAIIELSVEQTPLSFSLAFTRYRLRSPNLFKTADYGANSKVVGGSGGDGDGGGGDGGDYDAV